MMASFYLAFVFQDGDTNTQKRVVGNAPSTSKRLKNRESFDELFCLVFDEDAE